MWESYTVTFIEYGNLQPNTPASATAECPPNVVTAPIIQERLSLPPTPEELARQEELLELELRNSSSSTSNRNSLNSVPQQPVAGDTAKKEKKPKKDKEKKVKGPLGKLASKKKKEEEEGPRPNIVASGPWKKVDLESGSKVDVAPGPTSSTTMMTTTTSPRAAPPAAAAPPLPPPAAAAPGSARRPDSPPPQPPVPPEKPNILSPRRPPPAPPAGAAAARVVDDDLLEPLPPIVTPTTLADHRLVGHLFVALCDLRRLHCDAWVVPTGLDYIPAGYWFLKPSAAVSARNYMGTGGSGLKYFGKDSRVKRAPGWPDDRPIPYMIAIERRDSSTTLEWLIEPVKQFLEVATLELKDTKPARGRLKVGKMSRSVVFPVHPNPSRSI